MKMKYIHKTGVSAFIDKQRRRLAIFSINLSTETSQHPRRIYVVLSAELA